MCTVTFVRSGNKTIITSNRDEQVERQAIGPRNYTIGNKILIFPKDPRAGGTWYAIDNMANVLVLLNGAMEKHQWKPPYRKSRGLIVVEILSSENPLSNWETINLHNIEPFTLVLLQKNSLFQLRWDGTNKEALSLDFQHNHIWSSATLYPKEIRANRSEWFKEFMAGRELVSPADMFEFHRYTKSENSANGLVIDRPGFLKTISITQTVIEENVISMTHYDLISGERFQNSFEI
jgi:hypothetical protein